MCNQSMNQCFFLLLLLLSGPVISQEMALMPPGFGIQSVTRDVSEYTLQEQELLALIQNKANENNLLADDFEVWSDKSNDWQSKTDWLKSASPLANMTIDNLSVRFMDDIAIVSFLLTTEDQHKKKSKQFVVDIWRKSTNKLMVRYISELANAASASVWPDRKF
ncbi:MAG: hypothetical protein RIR39_926 [Pseudomonadota bacterium]